MQKITIKRIYVPYDQHDGYRILIDRIWPRGINKTTAHVDLWLKEIAPSTALRQWFAHDLQKWPEFKSRYFKELANKKEMIDIILAKASTQQVTLLFSAKDEQHNNAVALNAYIKKYAGIIK